MRDLGSVKRKISHLAQSLYDGILLEIVSFLRRNLDRVSAQHVFDAGKMNRHLSVRWISSRRFLEFG